MRKKNSRIHQRTRQRQKLSRRTVIIILASCMTCMVIGLTVFFNMSRVDKSIANTNKGGPLKEFMVEEQEFTTEKSLPAMVINKNISSDPNVQLVRKIKEVHKVDNTSSK